jgi:C4-dicarboxylate-specific signal transduction histidine kinase
LGTILNNLEAAELVLNCKSPDLEELKELLVDIRRSNSRATEIIRHLRALMSKNYGNFQTVDINQIACDAMEIGKIQANANGVALHMALEPRAIPVMGDAIQLQQVFLNLVMNGIDAVKGCPPGHRDIVISTSEVEGRCVEVSVSDSGPGISDENMESIFNPFFSTKENGMGVGLSLCRTIVEGHNGLIQAANGCAGGAVFRFRLPAETRTALS